MLFVPLRLCLRFRNACICLRQASLQMLFSALMLVATGFGVFAFAAEVKTADVSQDAMVARERRRLEELFIWKMAEELKLSVQLEGSFAKAVRDLNAEKMRANQEVAKALEQLDQAQKSTPAKIRGETEKALKNYEKAWRAYGALPLREVVRLKAVLGADRVGRYLVAKSQMAEKLKALSAREADEAEAETAAPKK